MTPQPSALAALQRYDWYFEGTNKAAIGPAVNGCFLKYADVAAADILPDEITVVSGDHWWNAKREGNHYRTLDVAWPTQAQREAYAYSYRLGDQTFLCNINPATFAKRDGFPAPTDITPLYPSPSTAADDPNTCVLCKCRLPDAALREALDTCVTALDWIARRWDDSKTMAACADDAYEMKSEAAMALEKSGARTLLAGDKT